jgi:TonB family protein
MSANILVIEDESRYVEYVREALPESEFRLEIAGNMNDAVNCCADFEPAVVIITSVLPDLKIEDAITQLRARAGLRATPFLILMAGYSGDQSKEDAVGYGAQDILERPFGSEALRSRVEELIQSAPDAAATQAIPQEMLESLRRGAGLSEGEAPVTSSELFGDILSDMEGGEQQPVRPPVEVEEDQPVSVPEEPAPTPPEVPPPAKADDSAVDDALAEILSTEAAPSLKQATSTDEDVEKLLSETLSGLDIAALKKKPVEPSPEPDVSSASTPQPKEPLAPEAPVTVPEPPPEAEAPPEDTPPEIEARSEEGAGQEAEAVPEEEVEPEAEALSEEEAEPERRPPGDEPEGMPEELPPDEIGEPPAAEIPPPEGGQFGQYIIEERIATGGMADVYKARMMGMEGFQKTVAIKRILSTLTDSDEFVRMFIDEAKLAAQLNHNNIIHIYDLGKVDRSHYIAMEYIEGRDLRSVLSECRERDQTIPIELALYITDLLASALDYAHKKRDFDNQALGLVHRDVSPQNVLISYDGDVKLCDFGIAKAATKATQTRAGALKGKLQYMSPEQAWGKDIDHRSDIFSLGLVLFEMLTNDQVFTGTSELSVLEQVRDPIITAPSMKNPEVGPEIDRIVFLALNAERDERYQSAEDLKQDLEEVIRNKGWSADRSTLVAFLETFESEGESGPAADGAVAPPAPLPLSEPPLDTTPDAPLETAPGTSPSEEPRVSPALDEDLEKALSTPPPSAESPALDLEDSGFPMQEAAVGGGGKRLWLLVGSLAVVLAGAGWWYFFGREASTDSQPSARAVPVAAVATETPTPALMSDQELIEQAREVAAAEITRQEEELRRRLEEEFPTPTPIPPTPTPTDTETPLPTETPTPVPTDTPTPVPPTPTPIPPTATPSVREGDIVVRGPDVVPPVVIYQEEPEYPPIAERMRESGLVEAEALIGTDGSVEEVRITRVEGRNLGFEEATEDAIREWRYRPATKDGVRVRMWMTIRVPFNRQ